MNRNHLMVAAVVLALAAPSFAQNMRTTMPADYDVLTRKSIFSKNRFVRPQGRSNNSNDPSSPDYRPPRPAPRVYPPVLVGTMLEDDGYVAFIVNPMNQEIATLRAGDTLPANSGTVKDITLDYIDTTAAADHPGRRILIGQNLQGGPAEYPSAAPPDAPPAPAVAGGKEGGPPGGPPPGGGPPDEAGGGAPAAAPAAAAPPSSSGGGGGESMLERLRKRRQQQLGK